MTDTTLTLSTLTSQASVKFVDDPSKPGWEDFLASDLKDKDESTKEQDQGESSSSTF